MGGDNGQEVPGSLRKNSNTGQLAQQDPRPTPPCTSGITHHFSPLAWVSWQPVLPCWALESVWGQVTS